MLLGLSPRVAATSPTRDRISRGISLFASQSIPKTTRRLPRRFVDRHPLASWLSLEACVSARARNGRRFQQHAKSSTPLFPRALAREDPTGKADHVRLAQTELASLERAKLHRGVLCGRPSRRAGTRDRLVRRLSLRVTNDIQCDHPCSCRRESFVRGDVARARDPMPFDAHRLVAAIDQDVSDPHACNHNQRFRLRRCWTDGASRSASMNATMAPLLLARKESDVSSLLPHPPRKPLLASLPCRLRKRFLVPRSRRSPASHGQSCWLQGRDATNRIRLGLSLLRTR